MLSEHHLPKELGLLMPEDRRSYIQDILDDLMGLRPPSWVLEPKIAETVLHLADAGHVILVGRGASIITERMPNIFHVRLIGSLPKRIERVQTLQKLTPQEAAKARPQRGPGTRPLRPGPLSHPPGRRPFVSPDSQHRSHPGPRGRPRDRRCRPGVLSAGNGTRGVKRPVRPAGSRSTRPFDGFSAPSCRGAGVRGHQGSVLSWARGLRARTPVRRRTTPANKAGRCLVDHG